MAPKISVLIPTYNSSQFLKEALDSVLADTSSHFELDILVVDDGSTDDTPRIVRSYGDRVRFLPIPHTGCVGAVRNYGIRNSDAAYIAFLDHDDISLPGRLERQLALIQATNADLAVSDCLEFMPGSNVRRSFMEKNGLKKHLQAHLRGEVLTNALEMLLESGGLGPPSGAMARRKSLIALGLFPEDLFGVDDFDLYVRVAAFGRIAVDFTPLALRRLHANNASRASIRMVSGAITICRKLYDFAPVRNNDRYLKLVKNREARFQREQGSLQIEAEDRIGARRSWGSSLRLKPSFQVACYWALTFLPTVWVRYIQRAKAAIRFRLFRDK
jgi:glycosyltransferase involved in cell wall biosynthesis